MAVHSRSLAAVSIIIRCSAHDESRATLSLMVRESQYLSRRSHTNNIIIIIIIGLYDNYLEQQTVLEPAASSRRATHFGRPLRSARVDFRSLLALNKTPLSSQSSGRFIHGAARSGSN